MRHRERKRPFPGADRAQGNGDQPHFPLSRSEQIVAEVRASYRESDAGVSQPVGVRRGAVSLQRGVDYRALNSRLPAVPGIGAEFRVPNVIPFEIDKALEEPLQPQADPEYPITAAIEGLSQLNIYRRGMLVAVFPLSIARPGLRGRGTWAILGAIRVRAWQPGRRGGGKSPKTRSIVWKFDADTNADADQGEARVGAVSRPRSGNPAGIIWIDLAKSDSLTLPCGLHGTSIPDQMNTLESIGGLRLTNWDIARAVRLLPSGTPLEWKP